jgi:hypothetical protein
MLFAEAKISHAATGHVPAARGESSSGIELKLVREAKPNSQDAYLTAISNSAGDFDFKDVEPGDYRLGVSISGSGPQHFRTST